MNRNNLLTEGNEFKLPNGNFYTGYYHIHVSKGAMVGGQHVDSEHDLLTPVNQVVADRVKSIQTELVSERRRQRNLTINSNNQAPTSPIVSSPSPSGGGGGGGGGGGY